MLKNYIKIAWKVLLRRKFFTFVSLFGISFTLLVLMVVAALVDHISNPAAAGSKFDRCLHIHRIYLAGEKIEVSSYPSYDFLNRYVRMLKRPEQITIFSSASTVSSYVGNRKIEFQRKFTDAAFWEILEFDFIEGQPYDDNMVDNAEHVAVITERTRRQVFGNKEVVGEYLETTEANYRIVGVIPHEDVPFHSAYGDIYIPITVSKSAMTTTRLFSNCQAFVLAADKSDFDAIKTEYDGILAQALIDNEGKFHTIDCPLLTEFDFLAQMVFGFGTETGSIWALTGIIAIMILFMLFPAVNLININISRIIERASEIGVRKAFGASSRTLVGQFLVENVILTLIGGAVAYILALIALQMITNSGLIPYGQFGLNFRVFLICLALALFFGIFSGVLPAYRMSRLHPVDALKGIEI
jgi:putative ABC transport system permease protein